jgi:hypothetical protein
MRKNLLKYAARLRKNFNFYAVRLRKILKKMEK